MRHPLRRRPPGHANATTSATTTSSSSVDESLRRLGTDHLDILLLHRPDPLWQGEEIALAFETLKRAGKVRYFGVSNQNRFQMEYLQSFLPIRWW